MRRELPGCAGEEKRPENDSSEPPKTSYNSAAGSRAEDVR